MPEMEDFVEKRIKRRGFKRWNDKDAPERFLTK